MGWRCGGEINEVYPEAWLYMGWRNGGVMNAM